MPTILQFRRGTTVQNDNYTGSVGELTVDTDLDTIRIHDGSSAGGHTMPSLVATQTFTNKTLTAPVISGGSVNNTTIGASTASSGAFTTLSASSTAAFSGGVTIGSDSLAEYIADTVGAMVTSNTESGIAVTYVDADNTLDFDVGDFTITLGGDLSGSVTVTNLASATLTATIAANSVALGTDTTGNYIGEGATSGNGISGSNTGEGGTFTVASNATAVNTANTIVFRDASGNFAAGVITATTTNARYADLAEKYLADSAEYKPGQVLVFGGDNEVTISTSAYDHRVAGVVSTDPAFLMNDDLSDNNAVSVALTGRVPCQVQGPTKKGDLLVTSALPGVAMSMDKAKFEPGVTIGKAMQEVDGLVIQIIEIAVGRF